MTGVTMVSVMVVGYRFVLLMGEWSLCHGVLMGVGAYTAALLSTKLGFSFWATLPLAGLTAALVALVLSYSLLRMRAFSFFIGSLAAGEAIRLCWVNFYYPFRGNLGLSGIKPPTYLGAWANNNKFWRHAWHDGLLFFNDGSGFGMPGGYVSAREVIKNFNLSSYCYSGCFLIDFGLSKWLFSHLNRLSLRPRFHAGL